MKRATILGILWLTGCGIDSEPILGTGDDAGGASLGSDAGRTPEADGDIEQPAADADQCAADFDCLGVGYCAPREVCEGGDCVTPAHCVEADCGFAAQDEACDADYVSCPPGARASCGGECHALRTCEALPADELAGVGVWGARRAACGAAGGRVRLEIGAGLADCASGGAFVRLDYDPEGPTGEAIEVVAAQCEGEACAPLDQAWVRFQWHRDDRVTGWFYGLGAEGLAIEVAFDDATCGVAACED